MSGSTRMMMKTEFEALESIETVLTLCRETAASLGYELLTYVIDVAILQAKEETARAQPVADPT